MYTNELIHETSPYLLQHAHNPVNWYAWNKKAFDKAKEENKMLIISIGYAACHWCHVMEHESFENEKIAAFMNHNFVSIKVDREERPDVDMIYLNAAQLINGNGGWPLNALALPDGKPFFAATYFPPDRWMQLLEYFVNEYHNNKNELIEQALHLSEGIARVDKIPFNSEDSDFTEKALKDICDNLLRKVDKKLGGLASSIKFPMPSVWEWLLEYHSLSRDQNSLDAVVTTLNSMKDGGLYDQIGGGFARYSTDRYWHVPHFEKMLYDNAQLISLYSHAFQVTANNDYRQVVYDTVSFLTTELYDGKGFFSSLDADSEKEEGKYYTWNKEEIADILGDDTHSFCQYFGITETGNWEDGKNIPDRNWAKINGYNSSGNSLEKINASRKKLLQHRNRRTRPALDDKIITAWNAMLCSALFQAGRAFADKTLPSLGKKTLDFLLENAWDESKKVLNRNYQKRKATTPGFLDDYAFLIKALIDEYQVSFEILSLQTAKNLLQIVLDNFSDDSNSMFFYNDARFHELISRPAENSDGVIPSSGSVMAENLWLLGRLFDENSYTEQALKMVRNLKSEIFSAPEYQANWARLLLKVTGASSEIALIGENYHQLTTELQKHYLPQSLFCGSNGIENLPLLTGKHQKDKTLIYVCRNKSCKYPVEKAEKALALL